ncbi:DeoR family transcriptional regulator [Oceanobacillus kimchii]|uniref:HTH-type transcriptional repressor YcnK n=1 Tax=Oceanobacillus kimchii TaxID=746691 RepID=A0ABQ5TG15_9BACI|nr:DeoR family transcriptional regulator [Oceanobacillus kimchii]GLO64528.1 HTH-type transcriptional repressor YcnK [Oceanobacillus kimchii]
MSPEERKTEIRRLIEEENTLKISDLSDRFNVSEMTIHRDVKPLIKEGVVKKTFGGIMFVEEAKVNLQKCCSYCYKSTDNNNKLTYQLILDNNQIEVTCCSHCGMLRHDQLGEKVSQALCHDFLTNITVSAKMAWFVMDTTLQMNCCEPQILSFSKKDLADKFTKGFGGKVLSFEEAMQKLKTEMGLTSSCCNNHL